MPFIDDLDDYDPEKFAALADQDCDIGSLEPDLSYLESFTGLRAKLPVGRSYSISADVGDDEIEVSNNTYKLFLKIWCLQNIVDMKISWDDTSVNTGLGTYSEAVVRVPRNYSETWLNYRSSPIGVNIGYIDYPKVRLLLHTTAQRQKYSDTMSGKFDDFGKSSRFIDETSPFWYTFQVASIFQDLVLCSMEADQSPYLESAFGGLGKPCPFREYSNLLRFHRTYKNGTYMEIYRGLVHSSLEYKGQDKLVSEPPHLLEHCSRFEPQFHDWVKGHTPYVKVVDIDIPAELAEYRLTRVKPGTLESQVAGRLLQQGEIVSETKLKIHLNHNRLSAALVSGTPYLTTIELLEESRLNWRTVDTMSARTLGLIEDLNIFIPPDDPTPEELEEYVWFITKTRDFKKSLQKEYVYSKEALERVYLTGPMMVRSNWALAPRIRFETEFVFPFERDVERTEEIGLNAQLLSWIKNPVGTPPLETLEDDDFLVSKAVQQPPGWSICVITDDKKLWRRIASRARRSTLRVPVSMYYMYTYFGEGLEPLLPQDKRWKVLEDTGSIRAGEERYFRDGEFFPDGVQRYSLSYNGHWASNIVAEDNGVEWDYNPEPPRGWPEKFRIDPHIANHFNASRRRQFVPRENPGIY